VTFLENEQAVSIPSFSFSTVLSSLGNI